MMVEDSGTDCRLFVSLRKRQDDAWQNGHRLLVEDLIGAESTNLTTIQVQELIYAEYKWRTKLDGQCETEEYKRRFPGLATSLNRLFSVKYFFEADTETKSELSLNEADGPPVASTGRGLRDSQWGLGKGFRRHTQELKQNSVICDRYRVIRIVGRGGMGAVYEAIDQRLGTQVALKQKTANGDQMSKAFEREARLLSRLQHSSLPRVSDYFEEGANHYLVMDFVPGETLADLLALNEGPFSQAQIVEWASQLVRILQYLQGQTPAVVHRDIKPHNIKQKQNGELVLLDFGLAKGGIALPEVTSSQSVKGFTPAYAPIEQLTSIGTDPRSDIYSLGATLYHLITGRPPVDALTRATFLLNRAPDPLEDVEYYRGREVSKRVSRVLAQMLSVSRSERPDNLNELLSEFRRGLSEGGTNGFVERSRGQIMEDIPQQVSSALRRAQMLASNLREVKILWVDDYPLGIRRLSGLLNTLGITVDLVTSSSDALTKLKDDQYHLIISDIERRGVANDGILFLEQLHRRGIDTKLIFFINKIDHKLGTPPGAFGITNMGEELLHLICDVIERSIP